MGRGEANTRTAGAIRSSAGHTDNQGAKVDHNHYNIDTGSFQGVDGEFYEHNNSARELFNNQFEHFNHVDDGSEDHHHDLPLGH